MAGGVEDGRIVLQQRVPLEGEDVREDVVDGAGEDLGQIVDLGAHLGELQVVVGVAEAVGATQREPELLGDVGEERLVVQVALGLGDDPLDLVHLGQGRGNYTTSTNGIQTALAWVGLQTWNLRSVETRRRYARFLDGEHC